MREHRHWVLHTVLGVGYTLFGLTLTVQAITGSLVLRWSVVLPGMLLLAGLLVLLSGVLVDRRDRRA